MTYSEKVIDHYENPAQRRLFLTTATRTSAAAWSARRPAAT